MKAAPASISTSATSKECVKSQKSHLPKKSKPQNLLSHPQNNTPRKILRLCKGALLSIALCTSAQSSENPEYQTILETHETKDVLRANRRWHQFFRNIANTFNWQKHQTTLRHKSRYGTERMNDATGNKITKSKTDRKGEEANLKPPLDSNRLRKLLSPELS